MIAMTLLAASKETDNKLRWEAYVKEDDTKFLLYIPKWRVPQPWPSRIFVSIREGRPGEAVLPLRQSLDQISTDMPIQAEVQRVSDHTKTVRFAPLGDDKEWEIGEPYIPFSLIPGGVPERLIIEVRWDLSSRGQFSDFSE